MRLLPTAHSTRLHQVLEGLADTARHAAPSWLRLWLRRSVLRRSYVPPQGAPDPIPPHAEFADTARVCRTLLQESLVDFYLKSIDRDHGGYRDVPWGDAFAPAPRRVTIFQARQLWFFSALAARGLGGEPARAAAASGFAFIRTKCWDDHHEGLWLVASQAGEPLDRRKHVLAQSTAIYALATYHGATRDSHALELAQRLFRTLERHAHDAAHGGYVEWFEDDWTPITDPAFTYVGRGSQKTCVTHVHLLEAFSELARVWADPLLLERVEELVAILTGPVHDARLGRNFDRFEPDWRVAADPANAQVSYGHDLECVWIVLDTVETLGRDVGTRLPWAQSIADACLASAYDRRRGGFFTQGRPGRRAHDTRKFWWVQAEAMVALLNLYRLTQQRSYYAAFDATCRFAARHLIAPQGGWWGACRADGSRWPGVTRSGNWQGAYHAGRALLFSAEAMEGLSLGT